MRRAVLAASFAALALPAAAAAHARLLYSTPADGEVLRAPPRAVVLRFDDGIVVGPGNAAVDAHGASVLRGVPRAHGHVLTIPLEKLGDGSFTIRWSVVSDDGHDVGGIVAFAVGSAAVPYATLSAGGGGPPVDDVIERWLLVGGILVAAGASAFAVFVGRSRRVLVLAGAGFAVAGSGAVLELVRVPGGTRFGHAMLGVAIAAAAGASLAAVASRLAAAGPVLLVPAAATIVATSLGGHVLDAGVNRLDVPVDILHFAAASVWVGGLAALAVSLPAGGTRAAARFSRLALVSVAVVAATGVLRATSELSSFGQLGSTSYGRLLLVKSALLAALVGAGYLNRSYLLSRPGALRRSAAVELVLAAGLVVAVAWLTAVAPARVEASAGRAPAAPSTAGAPPPPPADALTVAGQLRSLGVALSVSAAGSSFAARVSVLGSQGDGVDGLSVLVAGRRTTRCGFGCYAARIPVARTVWVSVGKGLLTFALPPTPFRSGLAELRRVGARYLRARTVTFHERLSSGPRQVVTSSWRLQAPSSLSFSASDGSSGVIVGGRRWDRQQGGSWIPSQQSPKVPQPQVPWSTRPANVVSLGTAMLAGRRVERIAFLDPSTPAWYTVTADARTHALVRMDMVAPAHFMRDDRIELDRPFAIRPPR